MTAFRFKKEITLFDPFQKYGPHFPCGENNSIAVLITPKQNPIKISHPWGRGYGDYAKAWIILYKSRIILLWNHENSTTLLTSWIQFFD